ncbi:MAG: mechanosensitive ion channel family protein [Pseudomonadota bacterium]
MKRSEQLSSVSQDAAPAQPSQDDATAALSDAASDIGTLIETLGPRLEEARAWISENGSDFAIALGAWLAVFLALRFLRPVLSGFIRSRKQGDYALRNIVSRLVSGTWGVFLLVVAAALVAPFLPILPKGWDAIARSLAIVIGVIQGAIWTREIIVSLIVARADRENSGYASSVLSNAVSLIKTLVSIGVWTIAVLMILSNLGIEITALIAGLGVGGIAIGLAAQSLFKDLFSSLAIVLDQPFKRGDFIMFDHQQYIGTVEKIGMKTTRLTGLGGEQIVIANSNLLDYEIRNYQRMEERRIIFTLGVLYSTEHEKLKQIPDLLRQAVETVDGARFERAHLKEYGDSAIIFEIVYFVLDKDYNTYMSRNQDVLLNIHRAFEDAGVQFAFPTRTLHLETMPENAQTSS